MKTVIKTIVTCYLSLLSLLSVGQHRVLRGIVTDAVTHTPVSDLTVYSSQFSGSAVTNDLGQYTLSLDGASARPGDNLQINTINSSYGASEHRCVLANNGAFDFCVDKHPNTLFATGIVRDARTRDGLADVELSAVVDGATIDVGSVRTDRFGNFKIPLNKLQIRNERYIRLMVRDPNHRYATGNVSGTLVNINACIELLLDPHPSPAARMRVNSFKQTDIHVSAGNVVTIDAEGNMELGQIIGTSGPDGKEAGAFGMSLGPYSIIRTFNHGALMYRLSGNSEWKVAGKHTRFIASSDGELQLQINDKQQYDNRGAYSVSVVVER